MSERKRWFVKVQWRGRVRTLEYIPVKFLRDIRLLLSAVYEYRSNGHPFVILEVKRQGDQDITRTLLWNRTKREIFQLLKWDGVGEIPIAFAKSERGQRDESERAEDSELVETGATETPNGSGDLSPSESA